ncbi:fimbrial protein [Enterobacter chengduensis]|uniref:fimbrial protein n=1 Tax=Enterobacter chengduensis TaxID=2494701 RepID=UPI0020057600|nr:fimbrial protein [Enterobacter chengduensis]MCK7430818.1 fimbrial protein [Enterobacter chengduensis]
MKKIAIIAAMGAAFVAAGVQASTGTINFTGTVTSQTCAASVGGINAPTAATVALPAVQASALSAAAATAGRTAFQIALTGCSTTAGSGANTVKAFFESGSTVDSAGRLSNSATGATAATNVALQLVDGTTNGVIAAGNASQNTGGYVTISASAASLPYYVQYIATTGAASAGSVTSSVTYSLIYQ